MTVRRTASVIVPTRDRPAVLSRCLEALRNQEDIDLEVIVVDDGSSDQVGVQAVAAAHETSRVVRLTGRGPAAARNAGASAATNATVLFTDDDCIPDPIWAATLEKAVSEGERDAVGGLAVSAHDAPAVVVASELIFRYVQERLQLLGTLRGRFPPSRARRGGDTRTGTQSSQVLASTPSLWQGGTSVRAVVPGRPTSAGRFLHSSHRHRVSSRAG